MLTINGTFIQSLPTQEGESQRGHWVRGGYVIETDEEYPRKVAFSVFGEEKVAQCNLEPKTPVQVRFTPESREYNGRWYTDLRSISVTPLGQGVAQATRQPAQPAPTAQPAPAAKMPDSDPDLPF